MTALAVRASHVSFPQLSWPRIGAWSGSFSLHLVIAALLLAPPVAIEFARRAEPTVIPIKLIEERKPVVVDVPDDPQPPTHSKPKPVHTTPPAIPIAPERTDMSYSVPPVDTKPTDIGNKPVAPIETAPSAIAYGNQTRVDYPVESKRNHEQGTVLLRVLVDADGTVQTVEIEKSSGFQRLDRAARDAVRKWSFHAATRNGLTHSAWALVPITFNLSLL
jgi:protein TonB